MIDWLQRIERRLESGDRLMQWLVEEHGRHVDRIAALTARPQVEAPVHQRSDPGLLASITELLKAARDLVKAIMSLKEWAVGGGLVLLSIAVIYNPALVKDLIELVRAITAVLSD